MYNIQIKALKIFLKLFNIIYVFKTLTNHKIFIISRKSFIFPLFFDVFLNLLRGIVNINNKHN